MSCSPLRAFCVLLIAGVAAASVQAVPGTEGEASGPGGPAAISAPRLEDTSWLLAAYRAGKGNGLAEIIPGNRPPRFRFEAGRVGGTAGCNQLGGAYTLDGNALTFQANMAATMMACPEPLMKQEQAVGAALTKVASYRLDGELLEFLDAAGQPLLRFLLLKPTPLVGQSWQLTEYNNGKQAIVSVLSGTELSLEFRDDGTLGGFDGCNRYMSGYTLEGETLTIGPLATTRMACKGPTGAAEQARSYAAALGTVAGYRIEGGELTLTTAEGQPAARYRAEVVPPVEALGEASQDGATEGKTPETEQAPPQSPPPPQAR